MSRVLCVVPTLWPPPLALDWAARSWLLDCDAVVFSISKGELSSYAANSSLKVLIKPSRTVSILATHEKNESKQPDVWVPVRAAIAYVAQHNMTRFDWLLLAEDDAFVVLSRLRQFLRLHSASMPLFFGGCVCRRAPGINIFSRAALDHLLPHLPSCAPVQTFADVNHRISKVYGASDVSIMSCLNRAKLTCTRPLDADGHALLSVWKYTKKGWLDALMHNISKGHNFCSRDPCTIAEPDITPPCFSSRAFGFHSRHLKSDGALREALQREYAPLMMPAHRVRVQPS